MSQQQNNNTTGRRRRRNRARNQPFNSNNVGRSVLGDGVVVVKPAAATATATRPRRRNRRRNNASNGLLANIGGFAGGLFGPTGERLGRAAGTGLARIFGSGDYVITPPPVANSLYGTTPPQFGPTMGTITVPNKEYITDIYSSTDFKCRSYPIQPAVPTLFPWLSLIAKSYEQYRIKGLMFEYKSTSGASLNSTNTALGVVGMVTQYDASEPIFTTKREAEHYIGCQSAGPSQSMMHFVECKRGTNPLDALYTRTGALPEDQDIKFYDMGSLQLFTQGMQQDDVNIGELWVSYDIEFSKPKLPTGGEPQFAQVDSYNVVGVGANNIYLSGKVEGAKTTPQINNVGTYIINNKIHFPETVPKGRYMIDMCGRLRSGTGADQVWQVGTPVWTNCLAAAILPSLNGGYINSYVFSTFATGQTFIYYTAAIDNYKRGACSYELLGVNLAGSAASTWDMQYNIYAIKNPVTESKTQTRFEQMLQDKGLDLEVIKQAIGWYQTLNQIQDVSTKPLLHSGEEHRDKEEEIPRKRTEISMDILE